MIKVFKNMKEGNDRIIQRFSSKVKASRIVPIVKEKRYRVKPKTKRQVKAAALKRTYYRNLREKMKYYS